MTTHYAPSIFLKKATLHYQGHLLFADLDLTLPTQQFTCLLGPSGVGKTSLLRMIAGLSTGKYTASITTSDQLPLTGRLSYLAQQDLLMPWCSVLENVTVGARLRHGKTTPQQTTAHALNLLSAVGLKSAAAKMPQQLSGGMRQRVALARTLFEDRPVVLMDEPFAAVDAITRLRLQNLAADLLKERTVLLITHDPLEALRLGHQIYVLQGHPAHLGTAIIPPGEPPRELSGEVLFEMQNKLLQRLATHPVDEL